MPHMLNEGDVQYVDLLLLNTVGQVRNSNQLLYVENMLNVSLPIMRGIVAGDVLMVSNEMWSSITEDWRSEFAGVVASHEKHYSKPGQEYRPYGSP